MLKINFSKKTKNSSSSQTPELGVQDKNSDILKAFKVGDTVVYPFYGVGVIEKKESREAQGRTVEFFVINIQANKMNISTPIELMQEKGIRHLISKKEMDEALPHLKDKPDNVGVDWKVRQQINNDLAKKGDIMSTIKVITSLNARNKEKELPLQERRLYDSSITMLTHETALVYNITPEEAEEMIRSSLP